MHVPEPIIDGYTLINFNFLDFSYSYINVLYIKFCPNNINCSITTKKFLISLLKIQKSLFN